MRISLFTYFLIGQPLSGRVEQGCEATCVPPQSSNITLRSPLLQPYLVPFSAFYTAALLSVPTFSLRIIKNGNEEVTGIEK